MKLQLLAVALAGALSTNAFAQSTLESDKDKLSYGLGMMVSDQVLRGYGEIDYDIFLEAMKAQDAGTETQMTINEAQNVLRKKQAEVAEMAAAEAEKAEAEAILAGEKYLKENATRDGVTVTDSGLQYEVITPTEGAKPSAEDTVSVHYVGTLLNGTEFDSSIARGNPISFELNRVIPGWTEGVQLMNVGSKYRFVIPSDIAYGKQGSGQIGPGETLIFEVELLEIVAK